jgi:hypothetical protein
MDMYSASQQPAASSQQPAASSQLELFATDSTAKLNNAVVPHS